MAVDLKRWRQRNAAERVKAALTRPKKDNTRERVRRQFATSAEKAVKALKAKGRSPWLKFGYNEDVVVTAKLGSQVIPVTGDEAIALNPREAEAYLRDVIDATNAGQLDPELLAAAAKTATPIPRSPEPKNVALVSAAESKTIRVMPAAPAGVARAPAKVDLRAER
jgi:hypothetical protein